VSRNARQTSTKKISTIKQLIIGKAAPFDTPTIHPLALRMLIFLRFELRHAGWRHY
jgi:hypothetical protein